MSEALESRVRAALMDAFHRLAPEIDFAAIDPNADLREEADLDSVDIVNLMVLIDETLGVEIPEADYQEVATLDGMVRYLAARIPLESPP